MSSTQPVGAIIIRSVNIRGINITRDLIKLSAWVVAGEPCERIEDCAEEGNGLYPLPCGSNAGSPLGTGMSAYKKQERNNSSLFFFIDYLPFIIPGSKAEMVFVVANCRSIFYFNVQEKITPLLMQFPVPDNDIDEGAFKVFDQ